jgi:hypothetical protein
MSRSAVVLFVVALALGAFGWWGLSTEAGRRRYDEMAGMIPMAAYYGGWALGAISVLWMLISAIAARN